MLLAWPSGVILWSHHNLSRELHRGTRLPLAQALRKRAPDIEPADAQDETRYSGEIDRELLVRPEAEVVLGRAVHRAGRPPDLYDPTTEGG